MTSEQQLLERYKATSRKVTIFRSATFLSSAQTGLDDYYSMAAKDVGSYGSATGGAGSGLDFEEIELLLPLVLDYQPSDREFKLKVKQFYDNMRTKVSHKDGAPLEIGLRKSNSEPLSKDNLPIIPIDYIRYRHALGHPWVAEDRDSGTGNGTKHFYISDPEKIRESGTGLRLQRERAMEAYLILTKESKDKPEQIDDVIAILGKDPRTYKGREEKLDFLEEQAKSEKLEDLNKFIEIAGDKKIAMRGFVQKLVFTGILRKVGSRYLVAETDKVLGDSLEEVMLELEDTTKNGQLITVFKSQLQEKMKAEMPKNFKQKAVAR
jgi:hypothetical protein